MRRSALVLPSAALLAGLMLPVASARSFKGPAARSMSPAVEHAGRLLQWPDDFVHAPEAITVGGDALFVVGNTTLSVGDTAVRNRLEALGFTLTIKSAFSAQTSDAESKALVFISSSASAGSVNTKFRDVAVPVMVAQNAIFDDMKMTGTTGGTHFGSTASQTQVVISNASHPLAGGLTGTVTVATSSSFAWGQVNSPPSVKAATIVSQSGRAAIFGYEPGDTMVGMAAPARRVGFFLSSSTFNTNGWTLFDAAVTWASNKVSAPTFSPTGGVYPSTELPAVEMFTDTPGAEIHYTTDNTTPTASSPLYTAPIPITSTTNLEARAFLSGWAPSDSTIDVYQVSFGTVADPVITPAGGSAIDSIEANISAEPGTTITYTTNGSEPQEWSQAYSGTLTFAADTNLRARAFKTDWTPSGTASALFQVWPPAPTINLAPGTYPLGQTTTVTANGANVTLRYSINGNDPTAADPIVASGGSIPIGAFTLKVNAWRPGCSPSATVQATYDVTGRVNNGAVAAGFQHSLALRPDGTVLQWGNSIGNTPRLVNGLSGVKAIAAGAGQSLALRTDGTVWTWNAGVAPVQQAGLANIVGISAGSSHSLALDGTGNLWAWGDNTFGQLGNGSTTPSATPVQVSGLANVTAFSAGGTHSLAVTSGGQAWAWGNNADQRLGDGTSVAYQTLPVTVKDQLGAPFSGVSAVSAGGQHSFAVTSSGAVYGWGSNLYGALGVGQSSATLGWSSYPRLVSSSVHRSLSAGSSHAVGAYQNGTMVAWGANGSGRLGNGNTTNQNAPVLVPGANVLQVSAGDAHSLALLADGTVLAWGANGYGQVGDGTNTQRTSPVPVQQWSFGTATPPTFTPSPGSFPGPMTVALAAEPGAQVFYQVSYSTNVPAPTLASLPYTAPIAVNATGMVIKAIAWRPDAALSPVATGTYNIQAAVPEMAPAGGTYPSAALDISVTCSTPGATIRYTMNGADPTIFDLVVPPSGIVTLVGGGTLKARAWAPSLDPSGVRSENYSLTGSITSGSLSAGGHHSLARDEAAAPWAWGANGSGTLGNGGYDDQSLPIPVTALPSVDAIEAGGYHSLAIVGGGVWAWGDNSQGQLGLGAGAPGYAATPLAVSGLSGVTAVAGGTMHTLALVGGAAWSWGDNSSGQIGDGGYGDRPAPGLVGGLSGVTLVALAAGDGHSLALDDLGRVWAWGGNGNGQLGDNSTTPRPLPVLITGFGGQTVTAIAAGLWHSVALTSNGQVWAWGYNSKGQIGDNTTTQRLVPTLVPSLTGVTAVAADGERTMAIKAGLVWSWGKGAYGQIGDGFNVNRLVPKQVLGGLSGIVRIAAGSEHSLALAHDGSVWAWGLNTAGQLGDGTNTERWLPVRVSGANFTWKVGTPVFGFPGCGGILPCSSDPAVTVTTVTPGATIHYTLNGIDPTEADPTVASGGSVTLTQSATLKARAWKGNAPPSDVASQAYTLSLPTPTLLPLAGAYVIGQTITATCSNPTGTLHYRTDGGVVTEADPLFPPGGLVLADTIDLRVRAFKTGWTASNPAFGVYQAKAPAPGVSLASGTYEGAQTATLSTTIPDSRIHFTTNGQPPTDLDPYVVSGGSVAVDRSMTLKARVWKANWALGDIAEGNYLVSLGPAAAPQFSPPPGTYPGTQTVSISSAGASIRYTVDGSEPGPNSTLYTSDLTVDSSVTLKARAYRLDYQPSATSTAAYTITSSAAATPWLYPLPGTYVSAQLVRATTATPAAILRYTIDGSEPDENDPVLLASGLRVDGTLQLKVRAFKAGLQPSGVRQGSYWITGMVSTFAHSAALRPDGTLWTWGHNGYGQLGAGTSGGSQPTPGRIYGSQQWVAISAGQYHSLGLDAQGRVWSWGLNLSGQLGDGTSTPHYSPQLVPGLTDVVGISAGSADSEYNSHSLAVKSDGTVWAWGSNAFRQLGSDSLTQSLVPIQVPGLSGISRVVAGHEFSLALKTDGGSSGTLYAWGDGSSGKLGIGPLPTPSYMRAQPETVLTGVTQFAGGLSHVMALKEDGTAWMWGGLDAPYPYTDVVSLSPVLVSGLSSRAAVSAGGSFSVALGQDLAGQAWGLNGYGQLGRGSNLPSFDTLPAAVSGLANAVAVTSGSSHTLALLRDGSIVGWGHNGSGELGDGTFSPRYLPTPVGFSESIATDMDGDGLLTALEGPAGCDPVNPDTNADGLLDGAAVAAGVSCSDLDVDDDGVANLLERTRGTDPFRPDTDDDGSNDQADCFPLDPTRWVCPQPDPNDHTPPIIMLTSPTNVTLISSVP